MSLRAGRVGVAPSEVDESGHIVGGGSGDSYTKAETDTLLAAKANKSYLTANNKIFNFAYDSETGKYGYKAGAQGDFHPFDDAGGVVGMNLPEATMTGMSLSENFEYVDGGYQIADGTDGNKILWFDVTVKKVASTGYDRINFPAGVATSWYCCLSYKGTLEEVTNFKVDAQYLYIRPERYMQLGTINVDQYARIIGQIKYVAP